MHRPVKSCDWPWLPTPEQATSVECVRQLGPVVFAVLALALLSLIVSACGGSGSSSVYVSSLVPCSVAHRTYGLKPGKHDAPQLLAVVGTPGGSLVYAASP